MRRPWHGCTGDLIQRDLLDLLIWKPLPPCFKLTMLARSDADERSATAPKLLTSGSQPAKNCAYTFRTPPRIGLTGRPITTCQMRWVVRTVCFAR